MSVEPAQAPSALLAAALGYAARGWLVFPIHGIDPATGWCDCRDEGCRNPAKHPRTAHGLLDATNDPERIARYWAAWPRANVGIDCGRSGLAVVDVDVKKGAEGRATMRWVLERHPDAFAAAELVSTPSGGLHYYFAGAVKTGTGTLGAGVDTRSVGGYVLAPPSVTLGEYDDARMPVKGSARPYERLLAVAALPRIPEGLLAAPGDFTLGSLLSEPRVAEGDAARAGVPHGEHRQALLWQAWHLRRVHGLSVEASLPILRAFADSGVLLGANPRDPFTDRDLTGMLERIEPQTAAAPPVVPVNPLAQMVTGAEVEDDRAPVWLVDGFVPQAELVLVYGDGGVGKTSFAGWLAAHATRRGLRVGAVTVEETFARFAARVALGGGDRARLFAPQTGALGLKFRDHAEWIEACIRENELDLLYFDSARSHFKAERGENEAISARANLEPLAWLAQRTGCTILGTFHENRAGSFMGSAEMRNVPRVLIEAKRNAADDLVLRVVKCNLGATTDKLVFRGAALPHTRRDGTAIHETVHPLDGSPAFTRPRELFVYAFHERQDGAEFALGDVAKDHDAELRARVYALLTADPTLSKREVTKQIGARATRVRELVDEFYLTTAR